MCCLIAGLGLIVPRIVIVVLWLLTPHVGQSFSGWLWPLLGLIFLPYTTLAYIAAMVYNHNTVDGLWLVVVIVAVLVDLGVIGGGHRARNWRRAD